MNSPAPILSYGRQRRRPRWVIVAVILVAIGAIELFLHRQPIEHWVELIERYHAVFHARVPRGQLMLSRPSDANWKTTSGFLDAVLSRTTTWSKSLQNTEINIDNLCFPMSSARPGDIGHAFIGCLRSPGGKTRLIVLSFNVMISNDLKKVYAHIDAQLFDPGSYRHPHFGTVTPSLGKGPGDYGSIYRGMPWIRFDILQYPPGALIQLSAGHVSDNDPATIRLPIVIDGKSDALLFTLCEGDSMSARFENGAKLPIRVTNSKRPQPPTTSRGAETRNNPSSRAGRPG